MALTGTGRMLSLAGLALLGSGILLGYQVLTLLSGAILGALIFAVLAVRRQPQLHVRRQVRPERVERGRYALALLKVRNIGRRPSTPVRASDPAGAERVEVDVPALARGQSVSRQYDIPTQRRGLLEVGPLTLTRTDPLGLMSARRTAGQSAQVWVHPLSHRVEVPVPGRARDVEGSSTDERFLGSQEFHALREYVIGDEPRQVHWKTTARTGQLMVREHLDLRRPGLVVVLDNRSRADDSDGDPFEEAVEAAASFAISAVRSGMPCRFLTTCGDDLVVPAGAYGAQRLLDRLAEVATMPAAGTPPASWFSPGLSGSCLAFIAAQLTVDEVPALLRARRHFEVVALLHLSMASSPPLPSGIQVLQAPTAVALCADWNRRARR